MPVDYKQQPIRAVANDVTGARALDVIYQNALMRPILALVNTSHRLRNAAAYCAVFVQVGPATPPNQQVTATGWIAEPGFGNLGYIYGSVTFIVPPGWYFRVVDNSPGVNISQIMDWWEVEL